MTQEEIE
jgi:hypothetical protein